MHVRQQHRKTGKKYAESDYCVYAICTQNFFKKCICKVSDIQQYLYKKCVHLYAYEKCDIAKSVHTYIYIQAMSIKCIYLSAAAGRRYKPKGAYTIYIYIFTRKSVHTIYTHQLYKYRRNVASRLCPDIFAGRASGRAPGTSGNIHMISKIRMSGNFQNPGIQRQR